MPKIHVLSKHVVNLIAAGEVVERPASVAKELIENSLDAGATSITVEIQKGGIGYLRVLDNGHGIAKEDVKTAFARHSTSKISTEADLDHIMTLGFRGEALAAISAVSKIDLFTKNVDEEVGSSLHSEGGEILSIEDAGVPNGTTIIVRDLFFNTPARMKFLRKDSSEGSAVEQVVLAAALSHPNVAFQFIREGKKVIQTSGDGNLKNCIFNALGSSFANEMVEAKSTQDNIRVSGYACKPIAARGNRMMQFFFINGRIVKSKMLSAALDEAYRDLLMKGKFPTCVLFFEIPPELVDVNAHPAKTEVKFADDRAVFKATYFAIKTALQNDAEHVAVDVKPVVQEKTIVAPTSPQTINVAPPATKPEMKTEAPKQYSFVVPELKKEEPQKPKMVFEQPSFFKREEPVAVAPKQEIEKPTPIPEPEVIVEPQTKDHRLIGELFATYLIVECGDEVVFIDKHAAHERVLFETLKKNVGAPDAQMLLQAIPVSVSKPEHTALLQATDELRALGFAVEELGETSIAVSEAPAALDVADVPQVICEIAENLLDGKQLSSPTQISELLHSIACKMAIKAGKRSDPQENKTLVDRVLFDPEIRYCPHGRPVSVVMTRAQFEKMFKRTL
ncbi:MAG: DNA mismatch repair endonuclease MutL [Ruminococcaceae bacterium]|nr:DNA mismatch repair endonuclease MutL [Oscillospiraceae bacterium]